MQNGKTTYLFLVSSLMLFSCNSGENTIEPENGILNLSGKKLSDPITLDGNWNFCWDQYLTFDSLGNHNLKNKQHIKVPSTWNQLHDSLKYEAFGKGVYHLKVKNNKSQNLELKFNTLVTSAYRVFIDTVQIGSSGNTGFDGNYKPAITSQVIPFTVSNNDFNIYIEVVSAVAILITILSPHWINAYPIRLKENTQIMNICEVW